jgi:hypothetical protein
LEVGLGLGEIGVVGAESVIEDGLGAFEGGVGGGQVAKVVEHVGEVGEGAGGVGVVAAEPGLIDVEGTLIVGVGGPQSPRW